MARHDPDALRITSAARPHSEEIRGRERRYIISMGIRTLCFLLALASIGHWFVWVFLAAALLLPYFAVVIANAGASPDPAGAYQGYNPDLKALGSTKTLGSTTTVGSTRADPDT